MGLPGARVLVEAIAKQLLCSIQQKNYMKVALLSCQCLCLFGKSGMLAKLLVKARVLGA